MRIFMRSLRIRGSKAGHDVLWTALFTPQPDPPTSAEFLALQQQDSVRCRAIYSICTQ